jgi:hypothetical protein
MARLLIVILSILTVHIVQSAEKPAAAKTEATAKPAEKAKEVVASSVLTVDTNIGGCLFPKGFESDLRDSSSFHSKDSGLGDSPSNPGCCP